MIRHISIIRLKRLTNRRYISLQLLMSISLSLSKNRRQIRPCLIFHRGQRTLIQQLSSTDWHRSQCHHSPSSLLDIREINHCTCTERRQRQCLHCNLTQKCQCPFTTNHQMSNDVEWIRKSDKRVNI